MKKKILTALYLILSVACLYWTWLANIVWIGGFISIFYGVFTAVFVLLGIVFIVTKKAKYKKAFLYAALVPIAIAVIIGVVSLVKLVVMYVKTLFALIFSH